MFYRLALDRIIWVFLVLALGSIVPSRVHAQRTSLWQRRDPAMVRPFADVKARRPGDLLVITINERSDVQNKDQRLLKKENGSSSKGSFNFGLSGDLGSTTAGATFDQATAGSRDFKGNTQFKSERAFIDQFTVMVIDTTANGNLLVSGTRHVSLEGDQRTLILTGIVRAADILPNNTISSQRVANLDIRYASATQQGVENKFLNQGWFGRKMNRFWPH